MAVAARKPTSIVIATTTSVTVIEFRAKVRKPSSEMTRWKWLRVSVLGKIVGSAVNTSVFGFSAVVTIQYTGKMVNRATTTAIALSRPRRNCLRARLVMPEPP